MGSPRVYSAAKAFFPLRGKSAEQAWDELTAMFVKDGPGVKSYIVNGYPLECVRRGHPGFISAGDMFKYNWENYVEIIQVTPQAYFAYDETYLPMSGPYMERAKAIDGKTRMEFFLRSHPEATLVEIRRRSRAVLSFAERMLGTHASSNAYLLQRILLGSISKQDEITSGAITIRRDDSYRIDF